MKKILFIVNDLNSGGAENYLLRFLRHYDGQITPVILCKSNRLGVLKQEYLEIQNISLKPMKIGFANAINLIQFLFFLKKEKFNSVVDFTGNFAGLTLMVAKYSGIKKRIVFYRRSSNPFVMNFYKKLYNSLMNKLVWCFATDILSNSKAAFQFFFRKEDKRFEVIQNGIDSNAFLCTNENLREELNIPKNAFVVSHVGRYAKAKNHETILKVAFRLCSQNKNIYFILCGKDVDKELNKEVKNRMLEDRIKLLPFRKDIINVLNTSDLFFFPSYTEGQPNALLEALITGLPFIASDIEPIKESIPKSHYHLLVAPDDVDGACMKIENLYRDSSSRDKLNLSCWAKDKYNPNILFKKFFKKL